MKALGNFVEQGLQVALLRDGFADNQQRLELLAGMLQPWGNGGLECRSVVRILHKTQNSTRFSGLTTWQGVRGERRFAYTLCAVKRGEVSLEEGNVKEKVGSCGVFWWMRLALSVALALTIVSCGQAPAPDRSPGIAEEPQPSSKSAGSTAPANTVTGDRYDLERDEERGGHTLKKHVGRTDEQLMERLRRERISAASTWTDRDAAEVTVAQALRAEQGRIDKWERRGYPRPNLALHYDAGRTIGRSLQRGDDHTVDCTSVVIVLRADGADGFYVLTTYPEARQ
jgi:hypothetical protein